MSDDDDLLRRFAALRAPTSLPSPPSFSEAPSRTVEDAAQRARTEDEDLERIAGSGLPQPGFGAQKPHEEGEEELERRVRGLRGEEGDTHHEEEDGFDEEVRFVSVTICGSERRIWFGWKDRTHV